MVGSVFIVSVINFPLHQHLATATPSFLLSQNLLIGTEMKTREEFGNMSYKETPDASVCGRSIHIMIFLTVQIGAVGFVKKLMTKTSPKNAVTTEPIYPTTSRPAAAPVPVLGVCARETLDTTDARRRRLHPL